MSKVLIVIDLQNDYFPGGKFPLWNTDATLTNIDNAIQKASDKDIPVVLIQHIADSSQGISPFFNEGTEGVDIHPVIKKVAPNAKIITKAFADGFYQTNLESILTELGATELLICGMMTQNCVTHTAISKSAEKYDVKILPDCCTTVNEMIHLIALRAVSTRVSFVPSTEEI
ncbi:cysteine hydrolase family protein [Gottfriedia acidiceleris]|uniref:cysteine hydrolase family protein n=1 Tax=Gottfriedia acidiceleris TaxID=371036 RepID=UPI002FFEC1E8